MVAGLQQQPPGFLLAAARLAAVLIDLGLLGPESTTKTKSDVRWCSILNRGRYSADMYYAIAVNEHRVRSVAGCWHALQDAWWLLRGDSRVL